MSPVSLFYRLTDESSSALPELSRVTLTRAVKTEDGQMLPVGASGTIVGIWAKGEAYEIEFMEPFHALETIEASQLEPVDQDDR